MPRHRRLLWERETPHHWDGEETDKGPGEGGHPSRDRRHAAEHGPAGLDMKDVLTSVQEMAKPTQGETPRARDPRQDDPVTDATETKPTGMFNEDGSSVGKASSRGGTADIQGAGGDGKEQPLGEEPTAVNLGPEYAERAQARVVSGAYGP